MDYYYPQQQQQQTRPFPFDSVSSSRQSNFAHFTQTSSIPAYSFQQQPQQQDGILKSLSTLLYTQTTSFRSVDNNYVSDSSLEFNRASFPPLHYSHTPINMNSHSYSCTPTSRYSNSNANAFSSYQSTTPPPPNSSFKNALYLTPSPSMPQTPSSENPTPEQVLDVRKRFDDLYRRTLTSRAESSNSNNNTPTDEIFLNHWNLVLIRSEGTISLGVEGFPSPPPTHYGFRDIFYTGEIVERISQTKIKSKNGRVFVLGPMNVNACIERNIPTPTIKAFLNGFPQNWKREFQASYFVHPFNPFDSCNELSPLSYPQTPLIGGGDESSLDDNSFVVTKAFDANTISQKPNQVYSFESTDEGEEKEVEIKKSRTEKLIQIEKEAKLHMSSPKTKPLPEIFLVPTPKSIKKSLSNIENESPMKLKSTKVAPNQSQEKEKVSRTPVRNEATQTSKSVNEKKVVLQNDSESEENLSPEIPEKCHPRVPLAEITNKTSKSNKSSETLKNTEQKPKVSKSKKKAAKPVEKEKTVAVEVKPKKVVKKKPVSKKRKLFESEGEETTQELKRVLYEGFLHSSDSSSSSEDESPRVTQVRQKKTELRKSKFGSTKKDDVLITKDLNSSLDSCKNISVTPQSNNKKVAKSKSSKKHTDKSLEKEKDVEKKVEKKAQKSVEKDAEKKVEKKKANKNGLDGEIDPTFLEEIPEELRNEVLRDLEYLEKQRKGTNSRAKKGKKAATKKGTTRTKNSGSNISNNNNKSQQKEKLVEEEKNNELLNEYISNGDDDSEYENEGTKKNIKRSKKESGKDEKEEEIEDNDTKESKKARKSSTEDQSDDEQPEDWGREEIQNLYSAYNSTPVDSRDFWSIVAQKLGNERTPEECAFRYQLSFPTPKKAEKKKPKEKQTENHEDSPQEKENEKEPLARKGTLKQKKQLREIVAKQDLNHTVDAFEATPLKKSSEFFRVNLDEEDDDLDTIFARINQTSVPPINSKTITKTTASPAGSGLLKKISNSHFDSYIHQRQTTKPLPYFSSSSSHATKSTSSLKLCSPIDMVGAITKLSKESTQPPSDSDGEDDFYLF